VFDGNGKYEAQWNNLHRPCGLYMAYTHNPACYIGELSVNRLNANLGPRVSIVDNQGKLLSRIGDPFAGTAPTSFIGPHGLAADSHGDLYVGEVCWTLCRGCSPVSRIPPTCGRCRNTSGFTEPKARPQLKWEKRHGDHSRERRVPVPHRRGLARLPDGWSFKEVGAVGVDANDNVYVFNRGEHPMMVFDRDGKFLRSWGEGQYPRAHGVHMGQTTRST